MTISTAETERGEQMSRYIDADALVIDYYDDYETKDDECSYPYVSISQIDSAPSIDIVRCKECKHWDTADGECYADRGIYFPKADDYCSYGERKGE